MITYRGDAREVLGRPPVHPFPARMAASVALESLTELKAPAVVLDPMVGSGTVLAVARRHGHRAIGFDVDPLAVLMSQVWTQALDEESVVERSLFVLERARRLFRILPVSGAYPRNADAETRDFVRYWFDPYARRQLAALALAIGEVDEGTERNALWCAFSRLIITKQAGASRARDLSHSRPHRAYERAQRKPFTWFEESVRRVSEGSLARTRARRGPACLVRVGDARALPLADRSVDLVCTSPPYLNAIDYMRCSKFALVWMGYSIHALRAIRSNAIGAEIASAGSDACSELLRRTGLHAALPDRTTGILCRYIEDTVATLSEISRVLKANGRAVFVVGENTIRGTFVPTGRIIALAAKRVGLRLERRHTRALPSKSRYLPPPGSAGSQMDARIAREVVLTFSRD